MGHIERLTFVYEINNGRGIRGVCRDRFVYHCPYNVCILTFCKDVELEIFQTRITSKPDQIYVFIFSSPPSRLGPKSSCWPVDYFSFQVSSPFLKQKTNTEARWGPTLGSVICCKNVCMNKQAIWKSIYETWRSSSCRYTPLISMKSLLM